MRVSRAVKRLSLAALVVALLVPVAPAPGAGRITPVRVHQVPPDWWGGVGGPVFAGDAIVWGRPVRAGYQVLVQRGDRADRRTIRFDGIRHDRQYVARLAASSSRFGLNLEVTACPGERGCESGFYPEVANLVVTGGLSGRRMNTLTSGCGPADPTPDGVVGSYTPVDVWRDVVAWTGCDPWRVRLRDFAPRARTAGRDYPVGESRVAGRYLARYRVSDVTVSNWRTGTELFSVDASSFALPFDVDAHGLLALSDADNNATVVWASPAHPEQHVVANDAARRVVVAGGRIAYTTFDYDMGTNFHVVALDGSSLADAHDPDAITSADYDGRRLTWITTPCATGGLVVWDLAGAPPRPPSGSCPFPHVVRGSARLDRHDSVRVALRCPDRPWLGCAGSVAARNPRYRGPEGGYAYSLPYASDNGGTKRVALATNFHALCEDRDGVAHTEVVIFSRRRSGAPRGERPRWRHHVVTVHGVHRDLPRCTA